MAAQIATTRPTTFSSEKTVRRAPCLQLPVRKGRTVPSSTRATTTQGTAGPRIHITKVSAWSTRMVDSPPISTERKNIARPMAL